MKFNYKELYVKDKADHLKVAHNITHIPRKKEDNYESTLGFHIGFKIYEIEILYDDRKLLLCDEISNLMESYTYNSKSSKDLIFDLVKLIRKKDCKSYLNEEFFKQMKRELNNL